MATYRALTLNAGIYVISDSNEVIVGSGIRSNNASLTINSGGGNVVIGGGATASELRLLEPSGSGTSYTAFVAQTQSGNITYTLPAALPASNGFVLSCTTAGVQSWVAQSGGGGGISSGPFSSRPAEGTAGRLYLPTDGEHIFEDNGTSWLAWGPLMPMTPPPTAGWTWVNQGSATLNTFGSVLQLQTPGTSGTSLNMQVKSVVSQPYTVTAYFVGTLFPTNFAAAGLVLRESGSGKLATLGLQYNSGYTIEYDKWNSPTSNNSGYGNQANSVTSAWLRIVDDGTNRVYYFSRDGLYFNSLNSVSRTDFITPDQYGWFINSEANKSCAVTLYSWVVTQP